MPVPLHERAFRVFVGGAQGGLRREFHRPRPLIVSEAKGSKLYTVDGEKLLDYHLAFGAVVLGHSDPDVAMAVSSQAARLVLHGAGASDVEIEYGELLASLIPGGEAVLFTNSGSESVMMALRLARAYTGRSLIVKFEGNYHGWHVFSLYNVSTPLEAGGLRAESDGIPGGAASTVAVLPYNDSESLATFMGEKGGEVAAVILEPVAHSMGVVPADRGFVMEAYRLCRSYGCLLVFDEIVTCVRHSLRGMQGYYGVEADLTTLGKGIANGLPVAAVVGGRRVMGLLEDRVVSSGTYSAHPISMAGGLAALRKAVEMRLDELLRRVAESHVKALRDALEESGVEAAVSHFGGAFSVHFGLEDPPRRLGDALKADLGAYRRFTHSLRLNGVLVSPNPLKRFHVSASHSERDLERFQEAVAKSLKGLEQL